MFGKDKRASLLRRGENFGGVQIYVGGFEVSLLSNKRSLSSTVDVDVAAVRRRAFAGNPHGRESLSTDDLLVLTSSDQLLLMPKIIVPFL
jgi:hypothetical protein